jgi:hypothetical protein
MEILPLIFLELLKKVTISLARRAGVPTEIQTENLQSNDL